MPLRTPASSRPSRATRWLRRSAAVLALGVACSVVAPAALAEPEPTIEQVRAQVADLREQAAVAGERYNDARLAVEEAKARLAAAQEREAAQARAVEALRKEMGQVARDAYKDGGLGTELGLLFSDDPDAYLAQVGDVEKLGQRQQRAMTALTEAQEQLAADRVAVAGQLAEVEAAVTAVEKERTAAEEALSAAEAELARLTEEQRRALEAAQEAAEQAAAERRRAEAAARPSRSTSRGATAPAQAAASVPTGSGTTVSCAGRSIQAPNDRAAAVIRFACAQLGEPYLYGAEGPDRWDCSGLTMMAWRQGGVSLPHSSKAQSQYGTRVSRSQLLPGDLVFSFSPISHVSIYIGGGEMLYAPRSGSHVKIAGVDVMPYNTAVRLW